MCVSSPSTGPVWAGPRTAGRAVEWPATVAACADLLGLERFGLLGWSGGGPYVVACLAALPDRVLAAALVAPAELPGARTVAGRLREHAVLLPTLLAVAVASPLGRVPTVRTILPDVVASLARSARALPWWGSRELAIRSDWGDQLDGARAALSSRAQAGRPVPVRVWHGAADRTVRVQAGKEIARRLGVPVEVDPDADHLSIVLRHADEIAEFLGRAPERRSVR